VGRQVNPPQLLHFATHGYFFPNQPSIPELPVRAQRIQTAQHPLVRSGLILAEANSYWNEMPVPLNTVDHLDDGVLTAYEVSQLHLEGTELVVLSACETGLGDIRGNEGVYGLQSAFKLAGASKLLVSLWKIPDEPTAKLMGYFYTSYLLEKKSIREALLTAQRKMRSDGWSPYYWAAFVLIE
jgi:CHAT domain-containing protein